MMFIVIVIAGVVWFIWKANRENSLDNDYQIAEFQKYLDKYGFIAETPEDVCIYQFSYNLENIALKTLKNSKNHSNMQRSLDADLAMAMCYKDMKKNIHELASLRGWSITKCETLLETGRDLARFNVFGKR